MQSSTTYNPTLRANQDQLILDNLDYVSRILSTMTVAARDSDSAESLHSAGVLGLVEAANSFDSRRAIPFRTFAYPRIRGAIIDELRKQSPVSQQILKQIGMVKRAREVVAPPATPEALAEQSGLTLDQVLDCLEAIRFINPDDWNDLSDVVHASWKRHASDSDTLELTETRDLVASAIEQLPDKERCVLTLYYHDGLNLAEVGAVMELSESRVSRILAAARFRIQEQIECKIR